MVRAVVAEFHLHGPGAACERQELMAQTDPEDGKACVEQLLDGLDRVVARLRVTRTVRKKNTVGRQAQDFVGLSRCRDDGQAAVGVRQHTEDVAFDTEVVGHHMVGRNVLRIDRLTLGPDALLIPLIMTLRGHQLREVHPLQTGKLLRRLHRFLRIRVGAGEYAPTLRALVTNDASQLACVDVRNRYRVATP